MFLSQTKVPREKHSILAAFEGLGRALLVCVAILAATLLVDLSKEALPGFAPYAAGAFWLLILLLSVGLVAEQHLADK